jgi:hypothetical protein
VKATRTKRQWIAWILMLCLLPLTAVKLTHYHREEGGSCRLDASQTAAGHGHEHEHEHGGGDDCVICKFILSPFLDSVMNGHTVFLAEIRLEPVIYRSRHILETTCYFFLRAPPVFLTV